MLRRIAVIGAGLMGHGIAQVSAQAGYDVYMVDVSEELLSKALERIKWSLSKLVEKGRISEEESSGALSRIRTTTSIEEAVSDADLVIEAIPEDAELKKKVFNKIDEAIRKDALIASNTSTIPISELQGSVSNPQRFLGLHFFNPPQLMQLVEVIKGERTSEDAIEAGVEYVRSIKKEPIVCLKDLPGFIVNRILIQLYYVAARMVKENEATVEEVDSAVKHRLGLPMGLFELADYTGIDTCYRVGVEIASRDRAFRPIELFKEMVEKGELGVKSGKGFYTYSGKMYERPLIPPEAGASFDVLKVISPGINMAAQLVELGVATVEDVDRAVKLGLGFPKGIFEMADELGIDKIVEALRGLESKYGEVCKPTLLLTEMVSEGRLGVKSGAGFYDYEKGKKFSEIILRQEPPIGWIILNRPHRLNSLTPTLLRELEEALEDLKQSKDIRVVVIKGAGDRAFSAGADVSLFPRMTGSPLDTIIYSDLFNRVFNAIEDYPKPVIAAINGYALGGGCELAIACDFRIASTNSEIGQPEILLGIIPGASGTQRLTKMLGTARAKEIVMLGDRIKADEALRIGLVTRVFPTDRFEEEVKKFALRLAELPPVALMAAKRAVKVAAETALSSGQALENAYFGLLFSTKDAREGITAFLSKKRPEFKGE